MTLYIHYQTDSRFRQYVNVYSTSKTARSHSRLSRRRGEARVILALCVIPVSLAFERLSSNQNVCFTGADAVYLPGQSLILKPHGQAGSPGRGGYNLRDTLEWSPDRYARVQVSHCLNNCLEVLSVRQRFIKERIKYQLGKHLLVKGQTITRQPPETIQLIQDEVSFRVVACQSVD